jgi:hypothetical protein
MDGTDCALQCEEIAGADLIKGKLDNLGWGFKWGSTFKDPDSYFDLREERTRRELEELRKRRKSSGK